MAHGPYWADLPIGADGKHYVSPTKWDELVGNIIAWKADQNAGGHNLANLGALIFGAGGYVSGKLPITQSTDGSAIAVWLSKNNGGSADAVQIFDDRGYGGANAGIGLHIRSWWSGGDDTGYLMKLGSFDGGTELARFVVGLDGKVGVGGAPVAPLNVVGASSAASAALGQFIVQTSAGGNAEQLVLGVHDGDYSYLQAVKPGTGFRNLLLNPDGGNVGIGTVSPCTRLEVFAGWTPGPPATSGSSQTYGSIRSALGYSVLDFGALSTGAAWLQATDSRNLANTYALLLNPNGGLVGIGTKTPLSALHVAALPYSTNQSGGIMVSDTAATPNIVASWRLKIDGSGTHRIAFGWEAAAVTSAAEVISILGLSVGVGCMPASRFQVRAGADNDFHVQNISDTSIRLNATNAAGAANVPLQIYSSALSINSSAAKPGGGTWADTSDRVTKGEMRPFTDGLEVLEHLQPVWHTANGLAGTQAGFRGISIVAQEAERWAPYCVRIEQRKLREGDAAETAIRTFDFTPLLYALINSVNQLNRRLKALEGRN